MSKLILQDAVDPSRHTLDAGALYWPRYWPTMSDSFRTALLLLVTTAVTITISFATIPFPACCAVLGSCLHFCLVADLRATVDGRELAVPRRYLGRVRLFGIVFLIAPLLFSLKFAWLSVPLSFALVFFVPVSFSMFLKTHYVWYLSAHHNNTYETQQKWRAALCVLSDSTPATSGQIRDEEYLSFDDCIGRDWPNLSLRTTWHALLVFLFSPPEREQHAVTAPSWLATSPVGNTQQRKRLLVLSVASFVLAVGSSVQTAFGHLKPASENPSNFVASLFAGEIPLESILYICQDVAPLCAALTAVGPVAFFVCLHGYAGSEIHAARERLDTH